ncbi:MAG: HAMP domain-containing histidine kinase [Anaerolineales bacterium]|nr:HAMP domain-containing histidine kinase [Anaerolineales bacterium]
MSSDLLTAPDSTETVPPAGLLLAEGVRRLASGGAPAEVLLALLSLACQAAEAAEAGLLLVWDRAAGLLRPAAAAGYDLGRLAPLGLQLGEGLAGQVQETGLARWLAEPAEVAAAAAGWRPANRAALARARGDPALPASVLAAPLNAAGERLGVLQLESWRRPCAFTSADLAGAQSWADLAAVVLHSARLADQADAIRAAQTAERQRAELIATLSHELRMPLTAIKGYASALQLKEVDWSEAKSAEFLRLIEAECDNMQAMLKELLDSSLAAVDQLAMTPETVQLADLARHVAAEVQRGTRLHHLVVDFPPDFPVLECDPRWTLQVLRNLLDNAVKYAPQGGLIMLCGAVRPRDVVVSVSDQGIGIAAEDLIPLFEKYFRVKAAVGHHVPGAGLGLPIARHIVEAHGGRIWVESRPGEGTTVYFSLPRVGGGPAQEDLG